LGQKVVGEVLICDQANTAWLYTPDVLTGKHSVLTQRRSVHW